MSDSHCGPLRMPSLEGCAVVDMDALVTSSSYLRNMQRKLSKVQMQTNQLPPYGPVALKCDDRFRFGAEVTRVRKSAMPAGEVDRMSSEVYPLAAPYLPAVPGVDSRWVSRGTEITAAK